MVAQALGAGAGALLCAGPQALVCGAVGAAIVTGVLVGAWWMSSSSVENADEKAGAQLESGTVAATCATGNCPPPPECKELEDKIRERRNELKKRYDEMRKDEFDLYNNHLLESNPLYVDGVKIGSWNGHLRQFRQKQQSLRNAIKEAQDKKCPQGGHPSDKWKWATEPSPSQPAPK
jgi:DNA-binding transcriptional MerR regulator